MQKQIEYDCPYSKDRILLQIFRYIQLLFVTKLDIDILKTTLKFFVIKMNH